MCLHGIYFNFGKGSMEATVKRWGNSAAVRIPVEALKQARLAVDDPVELRVEKGRIVIELRGPRPIVLADLVGRIRPDNLHPSVDTGTPVGKEAW